MGSTPKSGFLLSVPNEAALARTVIAQAGHTIVAADQQKFGQRAPLVMCDGADVDTLVTDTPPGAAYSLVFENWQIAVVTAAPAEAA